MALTATEQLELVKGNVFPPSNALKDLVKQIALIKTKQFRDTYKDFDPEANPLAQIYLEKILGAGRSVYSLNDKTISSFLNLIIVVIGEANVTLATVQAATDAQWESFIYDNMDNVCEEYSNVTREEEIAYKALP